MAAGFFGPSLFCQLGVAFHQVVADQHHLGTGFPPIFMALGMLVLFRVVVLSDGEVFLHPLQGLFVLFFVVDLLVDTAVELGHIDVLIAHAKVGAEEFVLDR